MEPNLFDQSNTPLAGKGNAKNSDQHHTQSSASMRAPFHHNAPKGTSKVAAAMIAPYSGSMRDRVYRAIVESGEHGLTDDEGERILAMIAQSYTPRRGELVKAGIVVDSENRRITSNGRTAAVWVAVEQTTGGEA